MKKALWFEGMALTLSERSQVQIPNRPSRLHLGTSPHLGGGGVSQPYWTSQLSAQQKQRNL